MWPVGQVHLGGGGMRVGMEQEWEEYGPVRYAQTWKSHLKTSKSKDDSFLLLSPHVLGT